MHSWCGVSWFPVQWPIQKDWVSGKLGYDKLQWLVVLGAKSMANVTQPLPEQPSKMNTAKQVHLELFKHWSWNTSITRAFCILHCLYIGWCPARNNKWVFWWFSVSWSSYRSQWVAVSCPEFPAWMAGAPCVISCVIGYLQSYGILISLSTALFGNSTQHRALSWSELCSWHWCSHLYFVIFVILQKAIFGDITKWQDLFFKVSEPLQTSQEWGFSLLYRENLSP